MSDWSSYFSRAHKFLAQAEDHLRFIHTDNVLHCTDSRYYIQQAIYELELARVWITEYERSLDGK
jgi:hypothetical protein